MKPGFTGAFATHRRSLRTFLNKGIREPVFKILSVMFVVFCLVSGAFGLYFYKQYATVVELKPHRQIFER